MRTEDLTTFKLWCWRRLLKVPWTARRSKQSILREISPEYALEVLILKLKLKYFGHLMRTDSLEKTLMLGKPEGKRWRGQPRMRWLDSITNSMDMNESGVLQSMQWQRVRYNWGSDQQQKHTHNIEISEHPSAHSCIYKTIFSNTDVSSGSRNGTTNGVTQGSKMIIFSYHRSFYGFCEEHTEGLNQTLKISSEWPLWCQVMNEMNQEVAVENQKGRDWAGKEAPMEASWWTGCRGRSGPGIHASCASDLGAWVDDGATHWTVQIQTGKGLRRNTENLEATRGNLGWDIHLEISHRSQRMWKRSRLQRHFRSQQCATGVVLEGMVTKLQEGPWGMSIWGLSGENGHQGDREGTI